MALRTFLGAVIFCQLLVAMKGPRFASRPPELGDNLAPCVVLVDAEGTMCCTSAIPRTHARVFACMTSMRVCLSCMHSTAENSRLSTVHRRS